MAVAVVEISEVVVIDEVVMISEVVVTYTHKTHGAAVHTMLPSYLTLYLRSFLLRQGERRC